MKILLVLLLLLHQSVPLNAQVENSIKQKNILDSFPLWQPDSVRIIGKAIKGKAGTYSAKSDGMRTSNGETFSNGSFTAGSNKFEMNAWVKVTNLTNGKIVYVRINDRISKKKGAELILLTRQATGKLGFLKTGKANVKLSQVLVNNYQSNDSIVKDAVKLPENIAAIIDEKIQDSIVKIGKPINGIASFYSSNLDGTLTSTGERYRNKRFTAASNNFKLNTWVLVTNLSNKKTVIVRINDRMHPRMKKKGRVVDLSRVAADELDFIEKGLTKVKVQAIKIVPKEILPIIQKDTLVPNVDTTVLVDSLSAEPVKVVRKEKMGIASFYSKSFDGRRTATGEVFRNNKLSAASNDFKLNTWVRITNLKNNKSIILRINDRMHPKMQQKGRVVDVSRIAAQKLDFMKNGLVRVKVEEVKKGTVE